MDTAPSSPSRPVGGSLRAARAERGPRRLQYSADLSWSEPDDSGKVRFSGTATVGRRLRLERTRIRDEAWTPEVIDQFMANPVATYSHNSDFPLGLYESISYADGKLSVEGWISAKAVSPTRELFGDMVRDGRIRGLSVSIDVLDYEETPEGMDFTDIELWEISLTPTPRYAEALMTQVNNRGEKPHEEQENTEGKMNEIRKALGLSEDADEAAVIVAIDGLKAEVAKAPESQVNAKDEPEMSDREKELLAKVAELEAKELVSRHASKIGESESMKTWALSYAKENPKGFEAWAKVAPSATPPQGRVVNHSRLDTETTQRTSKTAEALGVTDEDREKYNAKNVSQFMFGKAGR